MTMSDPIADMLTRIRNANTAKHDTVDVPSSKMKLAIADILVKECRFGSKLILCIISLFTGCSIRIFNGCCAVRYPTQDNAHK